MSKHVATALSRLLLLLAMMMFVSCGDERKDLVDPDDTVFLPTGMYPTNIQSFDSYSADEVIKLYWTTGQHWDPMTPPPPDVTAVRIYVSETSPDEGFQLALERDHDGFDSHEFQEMLNGQVYFFRLATYTHKDSLMGVSRPLMTSPGPSGATVASFPLYQAESPQYINNLSWSPGGDRLALIRANESKGRPNLYALDLADLSLTRLTDFFGNYRLMGVAWSPDGSSLAYGYTASRTYASIDYRIWLLDLTTQQSRSISSGRIDDDPTWLSETDMIFTKGSYGTPNTPELYSVNVNSKAETRLTDDQQIKKYNPAVSPDRNLLVYTGHGNGVKLFISTPSGTDQRVLTMSVYWYDVHPSWSHDGRAVYFTSNRSGHDEVWTINIDGSGLKQVSHGLEVGVKHYYGRVSPDGRHAALLTSPKRGEYLFELLETVQ